MGGGISNSKVITEEGKCSLDAIQNNPNVEGSLRQEIESVSGKVDTHIVNAWNDFNQTSQSGYINLAKIRILNSYSDYPLKFTINGRGFVKPANLIILFRSSTSIDPDINKYITDLVTFGDYNYKFYIAKETTSVWNIYINHSSYVGLAVVGAEIFRTASRRYFEVTYPNVLVDFLPDGSLEFTTE